MTTRKWNNHEIDEALRGLGKSCDLPPERSAALEARIRREIISRYGSFSVPVREVVHTPEPAPRGIVFVSPDQVLLCKIWAGLRPALAFAAIAVLAVGVTAAVIGLRQSAPRGSITVPASAPSEVVAVAPPAPIVPGSGAAVSVFGNSVVSGQRSAVGTKPARQPAYRESQPVTPAQGVFTTWNKGVFSEEELMRQQAKEIGVFSG